MARRIYFEGFEYIVRKDGTVVGQVDPNLPPSGKNLSEVVDDYTIREVKTLAQRRR